MQRFPVIPVSLSTADAYAATSRTVRTRGRGRTSYDHDLVPSTPDADRFRRVARVRDRAAAAPPVRYAVAGERLGVQGPTSPRPPGTARTDAALPRRRGTPTVAGRGRASDTVDNLDTSTTGPGHLAGR